mgnify:CR=1 FL=1
MNNEDKLFSLMEKIYMELQETRNEVKEVKTDIKDIKGRVINIENDHGKKLTALFDGYTQLNEKADRIEDQVSKHDEIIIKRIK